MLGTSRWQRAPGLSKTAKVYTLDEAQLRQAIPGYGSHYRIQDTYQLAIDPAIGSITKYAFQRFPLQEGDVVELQPDNQDPILAFVVGSRLVVPMDGNVPMELWVPHFTPTYWRPPCGRSDCCGQRATSNSDNNGSNDFLWLNYGYRYPIWLPVGREFTQQDLFLSYTTNGQPHVALPVMVGEAVYYVVRSANHDQGVERFLSDVNRVVQQPGYLPISTETKTFRGIAPDRLISLV